MWYLDLPSTDPFFNLAAEEHLFQALPRGQSLFMLWQNDRAVVVGRYQDTIQEIDLQFVRQHGIRVVRRLSGGGAVYHDLGNLNFTFITDTPCQESISFQPFCQPIIDALAGLGISASLSGRNDILIQGKKCSGNSQYVRGSRVLHHGTLLFRSDLKTVAQALHVDREKIHSKGIPSVSSRVTNICNYLPQPISLDEFKQSLVKSISAKYPVTPYAIQEEDLSAIQALQKEKYGTWDWNYGHSPQHQITRKARIEGCGTIEVSISLTQGSSIEDIQFFGDFFSPIGIDTLSNCLRGQSYCRSSLQNILSSISIEPLIRALTPERLLDLLIG